MAARLFTFGRRYAQGLESGNKKPETSRGHLETVACNLCGSERQTAVYAMPDRRYFREEFFTVVECDECGLGFVNPRPTIAEMQKHYPAEYYWKPPTKSHEGYLRRRFTAQARFLTQLEGGTGRRKILDVGCANGDFPRFMTAGGWDVEGVEISESSDRIKDFRVHTQEFQDIPVNEPTYDAVTAWAVLEHVHDPMAQFRKASAVIKKGGLFVFLVQNFESVASRNLFCEDVPRHLYFFTRGTVRQYLEKTGFALEKEDNGRSIYKLAPYNWLAYMLRTKLLRIEFRYVNHLQGGLVTALKYAAYSPASVIDRMLWPALETGQILRRTYGVSTFVGRKV